MIFSFQEDTRVKRMVIRFPRELISLSLYTISIDLHIIGTVLMYSNQRGFQCKRIVRSKDGPALTLLEALEHIIRMRLWQISPSYLSVEGQENAWGTNSPCWSRQYHWQPCCRAKRITGVGRTSNRGNHPHQEWNVVQIK